MRRAGPRRSLVVNPTLQLAVALDVSERGAGRRRLEVTDPRAVRYLLAASAGDGRRPPLDRRLRRQLRAAGVLVAPARVPRDVYLEPRLDLATRPWRGGLPRLAAGYRLHRGPALPPDIARTTESFLPDAEVLWAPWPGSGIALPYTLAPLWLDGRRGPKAVRLGLGDGLLYRGDRDRHWRHPQRRGQTTVLASLHYGPPRAGG